jgi:hypothetical protein
VQNFKGWLDAFSKFKATAEAYLVSGRKLLISEAARDVEGGSEAVSG